MTSVSAGHIILTPTQPVGSGRPQRESNPEPPHQESRALPTELPRPLMNKKTVVKKVNIPLKPLSIVLKTYTGENVQICGEAEVVVTDDDKTATLPLIVVERGGPPLLGKDWIQHIQVDLRINTIVSHDKKLQKLLVDHNSVFKSAAGCLRDVKVTLYGKHGTTPKFHRARQPPYALREAIEEELSRLMRDGIVEPDDHSDWAIPIVPVRKRDGTVRICADYKITVNKVCKGDNHPIPRIEDLAYALSGGEKFTKLDLSHAYTQLQLDEESRKYTTINTHKGLFTYHRLCFGISAAPEDLSAHHGGCFSTCARLCKLPVRCLRDRQER